MRRTCIAAVATAALTAIAFPAAAAPEQEAPPLPPGFVVAQGEFETYREDADAITYDTVLVPVGAQIGVLSSRTSEGGTRVVLAVRGLVPEREYGAHVHVGECGASGDDAGPHFQYVQDPKPGPSVDPEYANPENEIWLDFTTNEEGEGLSASKVAWRFPDDRRPRSVVIHEHHTLTGPGEAGMAGARLACLNVPF